MAPGFGEIEGVNFGSRRSWFGEADQELLCRQQRVRLHSLFVDGARTNPRDHSLGLPAPYDDSSEPPASSYEPDPRGPLAERQLLVASYSRRARLAPEQVLLTSSTSEAYSYLLKALCDPGDAVLVPVPSYPLLSHLAQLSDVRLLSYRLAYDGAWYLDSGSLPRPSELERQRVRAILCVSPNNPTGQLITAAEFDHLEQLGLPMIIDEVFGPYRWDEACSLDPAADPLTRAWTVPTFVLDGLSKRALNPGAKLAWIVGLGEAAGPLLQRLETVADAYLSVSAASARWLAPSLRQEAALQRAVLARLRANREILALALDRSGVSLLPGDAGWSFIVRGPAVTSERDAHERLCARGVWLQPGWLYELPFEVSFVGSLLTPEAQMRELAQRLSVLEA